MNQETFLNKVDPTQYISAVLSGIQEEKDPRNLIITYDLIYFIMRTFGQQKTNLIEPFIEDVFDKISCYFPINFEPPKNDKF